MGPPPSPVSSTQVVLPRRPHTEEADEFFEVTNEALLMMSDLELRGLLAQLGINLPVVNGAPGWSRDKMLEVIMKVAASARDR